MRSEMLLLAISFPLALVVSERLTRRGSAERHPAFVDARGGPSRLEKLATPAGKSRRFWWAVVLSISGCRSRCSSRWSDASRPRGL